MKARPLHLALLSAGILIGASAADALGCDEDLFATARVAPADATAYVHVKDGRLLRTDLARRPIGRWVESALAGGQVREAWTRLATEAGIGTDTLFDACLGKEVTIVVRGTEDGHGPSEWAVLTEVEVAPVQAIEVKLNPLLPGPRSGMKVMELPEHGLLLARRDTQMVVGSTSHRRLFRQVVDRTRRRFRAADASLATHAAVARGRALGDGQAGILVRHDAPMGGWSVAVASLDDDRIDIRHAARFDSAPLTRPVTKLECDFGPVVALEPETLVVMMEPTDVSDGLAVTFIEQSFGIPMLGRELHRAMGPRRILTVGEEEGRTLERPMDLLTTSAAICIEVDDDDEAALAKLDTQMLQLSRRIRELGEGSFAIDVPRVLPDEGARQVDISPATRWFTGEFPIMRNITLNWDVVSGPHGKWLVVASHDRHLDEVASALSAGEKPVSVVGRFDSVGSADGQRLGQHLRSWADAAHLFGTEPEAVREFRSTMTLLSEFCSGVRRCHWKLARPCRNEMEVDVQLFLAPSESAEGGN